MNKTNFASNGGYPIVLDDFTFEQESVREAFKGAMSAFGLTAGDDFIISGCDLYGTFLTNYNPGYLFLKGEIYKVDGGVAPGLGVGLSRVWVADLSYDVNGDKVLENTSSIHAYHVRKAKMVSAVFDGSIHLNANTAKTFADKIIQIAVNDNSTNDLAGKILTVMGSEDWIDVPLSTAKYRKDKLGFVHLAGMIGQNNITTFTLPAGYRPASNQTFRVFWIDNPYSSYSNLTISTAGVVTSAIFSGAGTDREVSISGISFKI